MEQETPDKNKKSKKNVKTLIDIEWEVIDALHERLRNPDLTTTEYSKAAHSLAIHVNNLNRLLCKIDVECESGQQNLGEYVLNVRPRIFRHEERDRRIWKRRLTFRR